MYYFDNSFSPTIKPFMIVSAPYTDLKGQPKTFDSGILQRGLFLVARVDSDGNVIAFKITSQKNKFINEYTYLISSRTHAFLRTDSYVQFDKWHTLALSECMIVGSVVPSLRMALLRKFDLITREIDKGLKDNMSWETLSYCSPNRK